MKQSRALAIGSVICLLLSRIDSANAGVIVDQQPLNTGGPAADTLFIDMFCRTFWSLLADDFTLTADANVQHVTWWGFYGSTSGSGSNQPPAGDETMRVRFYGARSSDGLPDSANILFEQSFLNTTRVWTGRIIGGGTGAHE